MQPRRKENNGEADRTEGRGETRSAERDCTGKGGRPTRIEQEVGREGNKRTRGGDGKKEGKAVR